MSGSHTLYVTGIPPDMPLAGLRNLFSRCGEVTNANILDRKGSYIARAGFIEYAKPLEAFKAVEMFGNFKVGVHTIKAMHSKKSKQEGARDFDASKINLSELVERNIDHSAKRADERLRRPVANAVQNKAPKSTLYACNTCGKMCNTACSVCNSVHYCGSSCQKEDWLRHKKVCKSEQAVAENTKIKSPDRASNCSEGMHVEVDSAFVKEISQQLKSCAAVSPTKSNGSVSRSMPVEIPSPLKAGSNVEVQLLDLEDSGLIVCLTSGHNPDYAELDTLHKYYTDGHGEVPSVVKPGCFYACPFSTDAVWYRVFVEDVSEDASTCRVWYVDFGNFENVQMCDLRILTPGYAAVPMRTVRCKLLVGDCVPPSKIRDFFTESLSDPVVKIKVFKMVAAVAHVEMYGLVAGKLSFLNDLLVGDDVVNEKLDPMPNSGKEDICPDEKQTDQIDITNHNVNIPPSASTTTSVLTTRMSLGAVPKSGPGDANSLSDNPQIAKSSPKLQSVFKKFQPKASQKRPDLEIQPIVIPKGKFNGVVTHVKSVEELYVCLESDKEILFAMQSSLKEARSPDIRPQPYKKDMLCAYFDDTTNMCHRGRILATKEDKIRLFLLDDGRTKIVHSKNLRKLPMDSKYFVPPKAIPCKLKGCTLGDADYNIESGNLLKNCENEVMTMKIDETKESGLNPVTIYVSVEGTWMTVNWCVDNLRDDCELSCPSSRESLSNAEMVSTPERVTKTTPAASPKSVSPKKNPEVLVNHKPVQDSIANPVLSPKCKSASESNTVSPPVALPTLPISEILIAGKDVRIAITNVVSPEKFTFQILPGSFAEFNKFCDEMTSYYSKQDAKSPGTIQIGGVYAARYRLDERWYRAKVSEAMPDANAFKVIFLDFGNVEDVSCDDVRILHENYSKMPIQGMEARLYRYSPIDGDSVSECVCVMNSIMSNEIAAVVRGLDVDGDSTLLDIYAADDGVTLTDLFVQHQLAKLLPSEKVEDNKCEKPDIEVGVVTSTGKRHETGSSNSIIDVPDIPKTLDEHIVQRIIPVSPTVGKTGDVIMVHAIDPSEFYCQLITDELKAVLIKLSELNDGTAEIEMLVSGGVGEYCLARSSDGQLYRAEIIADDKDDSFTVRFVDYGNSEIVPRGNVTNMPKEYFLMESQAVKCSLHGCGPVDGVWSEDAIAVMKYLIERLGKAKFIGRGTDDVFEISLVLEDGTDVGEYLIQQAFAKRIDTIDGDKCVTSHDALPDSMAPEAKREDVEKAEARPGSPGMFGVKITMITPPVNVDEWPAEFVEMMQQCEGKLVQACVAREDDADSKRWSLTIPDVFVQVMQGA